MKERMFRLLKANEIECRVATIGEKGLSLLLYKDARVDQNILDETVGCDRWQRHHEVVNGNLFCNVGIWFDRKGDGFGEWVWKQDVGTESNTEKEKGQASDSFKRACFNWGIGRELYTAPFIWLTPDKYKASKGRNGQLTTYDRFNVAAIGYTNEGAISYLVIENRNQRKVVFTFGDQAKITKTQAETLKNMLKKNQIEWALSHYKVDQIENLSPSAYTELVTALNNKRQG